MGRKKGPRLHYRRTARLPLADWFSGERCGIRGARVGGRLRGVQVSDLPSGAPRPLPPRMMRNPPPTWLSVGVCVLCTWQLFSLQLLDPAFRQQMVAQILVFVRSFR